MPDKNPLIRHFYIKVKDSTLYKIITPHFFQSFLKAINSKIFGISINKVYICRSFFNTTLYRIKQYMCIVKLKG